MTTTTLLTHFAAYALGFLVATFWGAFVVARKLRGMQPPRVED